MANPNVVPASRCNEIQSAVGSDGFGQILSDCYTVDTDKWDRQFHGLLADNPAHWGSYIYTEGGERERKKNIKEKNTQLSLKKEKQQ